MLNSIVEFALKNKLGVLVVTGVIAFWCAFSLKDMAIDAVPDITNVQVQINVKTGALDPENIELQVTRPLEIDFSGIPNLIDMRSISKFGLSQITLIFKDDTDIYWARQQVAERMSAIHLPDNITPELAPITTGLGEVYMYTLLTDENSSLHTMDRQSKLRGLRTIQDYVVKPHLKRVNGVADVDSNGGFVKEIHINFIPDKMDKYGLTIRQLLSKLESLGISAGGGYIQTDQEQVIVRTFTQIVSLEDISMLSLGINSLGIPIKVSDIAEVREDHSLRVGAATYEGEENILGTVLMRVGANGKEVVEGVEEALKTLDLPKGIRIEELYTRKFLVNNTIKTVSTSLVEGAVLVILVLLVLLGNLKAAVIVALAIPLSMLVAVRGMNFFGVTGNLMSLGAIDFGLLVDGSVVIIESVLAHLAIKETKNKSEAIKRASLEVMGPVVAGLLLIMAVYIPILTLEGVEGKMFRPMAITVLLALGASLLIAVFVMPVLSDIFLKNIKISEDHDTWFFKKAKALFIPAFDKVMLHPIKAYASAGALFLVSMLLLIRMGSDFIPELDEGDLVLGLTRDARISIDASVNEQEKVEKLIMTYPEVKKVFARLGTPESATDPMGVNLADTFIILEKDRSKWRFKSKDELTSSLIKAVENEHPDTEVSATQPIGMRFNEMLEGSRADISLRITGPDLKELFEYGEKAREIILPIQGVESIEQDPLTALRRGPVLNIKPRFNQLAAYGISLFELNEAVEISLAGREVGSFIQDNIRFPIVTHLDESLRDRQGEISKLPIELPQGGTVPLANLATITQNEQVTTIARHWGNRYSAVSINVTGRDLGSLVSEAQSKIDKELEIKEGYSLSWGGQFKNMERANLRLMIIVPLTLLGVFLILWKVFGTLTPTLLVFASVPFAAVGGIFALAIRDLHLSVSAGVGFIALIGIALLNSLVLMNVLLHPPSDASLQDMVKKATLSRLRPVLMTAMVAGLGFLPMALNTGLGAEVQRPLATVVIGGLLSSTFLTLFLLPTVFLAWKKKSGES